MRAYGLAALALALLAPAMAGAQEDTPLSPAAAQLLHRGVDAVLAGCPRPLPRADCPAGRLLRAKPPQTVRTADGLRVTTQDAEYEGLELFLHQRRVVGLAVTSARWPVPQGLGVGSSAARIRAVLGPPSSTGGSPDGSTGLSYCERENCVQFLLDPAGQRITRVRWSFYYD